MGRYYCGRIDGKSWFGVGSCDVIRWDDVMEVQGYAISVAKAVNLGIENDLKIAHKLKKDLQSDTGLLIAFPVAILMDKLQRIIGSGEKLLNLVEV